MPELKLPEEKPKRYQLREGSQSAHCCFAFTVVDTHQPEKYGDARFMVVCECFDRSEADLIVSCLNTNHYGTPFSDRT